MTREEAIERIKARFDKWALDNEDMKAIQALIPELAESEDERIKKWLVNYFTEIGENWIHREFTCKQIVAYLEKQKEQPKEELVYRLNGFMQEYIKEGKDEAEKEHRFKCYHLFWDALEDENFFEQKEQKPDDDPLDDPKFIKGFDTGREVQRIFDEQKPAEWSEKDENALVSLHELIGFGFTEKFFDAQTAYDMRNWVNTRLKSLRPSWKPSEEQMDILDKVYHYLWADRNATADMQDGLGDFIEQLKAL